MSRGDSTLRGHGFLEPLLLEDNFGPFDATFHIPAFLEGGRTTVNGVHLLDGKPVHTTSFSKDRVFGFSSSSLAHWLEEKSHGLISSTNVQSVSTHELNKAFTSDNSFLFDRLNSLQNNVPVTVDASDYRHLTIFAECIRLLHYRKRFLFRSAASFLKALADPGLQPLEPSALVDLRRRNPDGQFLPGFIMVGSHVPLSDLQVDYLLQQTACTGVEISVHQFIDALNSPASDQVIADIESSLTSRLKNLLLSGVTPVLFSSRGEVILSSEEANRALSRELSQSMSRIAAALVSEIGYIICKGGTTTQTYLSFGLKLTSVYLEGQLLPGLSMVRATTGPSKDLPILTFPGNLGSSSTLMHAWELMEACRSS